MNRVDLYEVVSQVARLVRSLLGPNVDLKIEINNSTGATVHIAPISDEEVLPAVNAQVAQAPVAQSEPAKPPQEVLQHEPVSEAQVAAIIEKPGKTRTLSPEEFEGECQRILAIAETINPEESRAIDLLPWIAGKQVSAMVTRIKDAGYFVKVWSLYGRPVRYRHTKEGAARIFVSKTPPKKRVAVEPDATPEPPPTPAATATAVDVPKETPALALVTQTPQPTARVIEPEAERQPEPEAAPVQVDPVAPPVQEKPELVLPATWTQATTNQRPDNNGGPSGSKTQRQKTATVAPTEAKAAVPPITQEPEFVLDPTQYPVTEVGAVELFCSHEQLVAASARSRSMLYDKAQANEDFRPNQRKNGKGGNPRRSPKRGFR